MFIILNVLDSHWCCCDFLVGGLTTLLWSFGYVIVLGRLLVFADDLKLFRVIYQVMFWELK